MNTDEGHDRRLVAVLHDAMVASLWVALAMYGLTLLSFAVIAASHGWQAAFGGRLMGVGPETMAIVSVAALSCMKLTAVGFLALALGLGIWKRRTTRRLARSEPVARLAA